MKKTASRARAALLCACSILFTAGAAQAEGVNWVIAPYLWGSDVSMDVAINDNDIIGGEAAFSDLVDKLDMAFMGHAEVFGDRFGGFLDIIYIDLSDSQTTTFGPGGPLEGEATIDAGLEMQVFELGVFFRFPIADGRSNFDLLAGAREVSADVDVNINILDPISVVPPIQIDNSATDFFVGGRFVGKFNDRWGYKARLDYGGGGSEGAVNVLGTVGYTFGESGLFTLDVGYRYFNIELEETVTQAISGPVLSNTDITMAGPVVGFIFQF